MLNPVVYLSEPLVLGLHAMGEIVKNPNVALTTKDIARILGTSEPHLSKVLQHLRHRGFIKSQRGPGGGYVLNCNPEDVPLTHIFEALGGMFEPYHCNMLACKGKSCFISQMVDELGQACYRYLAQKNLKDFATYYESGKEVSIEVSVVTPSLGEQHPKIITEN